jgi:hypothetical protein
MSGMSLCWGRVAAAMGRLRAQVRGQNGQCAWGHITLLQWVQEPTHLPAPDSSVHGTTPSCQWCARCLLVLPKCCPQDFLRNWDPYAMLHHTNQPLLVDETAGLQRYMGGSNAPAYQHSQRGDSGWTNNSGSGYASIVLPNTK